MLKFENTEVFNFEGAIRGMRNPLNSWTKSDSKWNCINRTSDFFCTGECDDCEIYGYELGENDLTLAQKLIKAGSDHRKFMRQIMVCVDITAPLYWWKEFSTYKVGTVANSCSTMHAIHKKEFELSDFSIEHLSPFSLNHFNITINLLNDYRAEYNLATEKLKRDGLSYAEQKHIKAQAKYFWWQMIQLLPSSYNQKRTVTMSYENIYAMRKARKGHKQDEWSIDFMNWSDGLPYADELFNV